MLPCEQAELKNVPNEYHNESLILIWERSRKDNSNFPNATSNQISIQMKTAQEDITLLFTNAVENSATTGLKNKANINVTTQKELSSPDNFSECSPLHHASLKGDKEIVDILLASFSKNDDSFFKEEKRNKIKGFITAKYNGLTALHCAAMNGHKEVVDILLTSLSENANSFCREEKRNEIRKFIAEKNSDGLTALHCAAMNGRKEVVDILLASFRENVDSFFREERRNDIKKFIQAKDNSGRSALDYATMKRDKEVVDTLCQL